MKLHSDTPLWLAARTILYERGEEFFRHKEQVLKTADCESIHDLRVASRRLRESLVLLSPCYPAEGITKTVRRVRRVTRLLGDIRNKDEAALFFSGLAQELEGTFPEAEQFAASLVQGRDQQFKKVRKSLKAILDQSFRDKFLGVVNSLSLFSPSSNDINMFASVSVFARTAFDASAVGICELLPSACQVDQWAAQHQLRIKVKHFRYRMEILSFLFGADFAELHSVAKQYQEVLGKIHDLDVFGKMITSTGLTDSNGTVADLISEKRGARFNEFLCLLKKEPLHVLCDKVRILP